MASMATTHRAKQQAKSAPPTEERIQRAIAESGCPVLILGEHGAGKRFVAEQIYAQSNRFHNAFREICCMEVSEQAMLEALSAKSTVYLAEISNLSLSMQKLIVQAYFRSGQAPACRLLCGSSRELLEEVKSWRMREDFFYLVSSVTLRVPPLRCRKSEILSIVDELLTRYSTQFDRPRPVLCKQIIEYLMEHTWPGNLPELQTAIQTIVAIGDQAISLAAIRAAAPSRKPKENHRHLSLKEATRAAALQVERRLIPEVLATTGGNRKRAAADLGVSYKTLLYKLKQIETENQLVTCKNGDGL
jgi:two-component system, NtrC family, response regulator AtoC